MIPRIFHDGRGNFKAADSELDANWLQRCGWEEVFSPYAPMGWGFEVVEDAPDCVTTEPPKMKLWKVAIIALVFLVALVFVGYWLGRLMNGGR